MGAFDQSARYAAQAEPEAVLRRLLAEPGRALQFREWLDARTSPLPGERDLTADRVAALLDPTDPERPWLVLLEFQAQHDPDKLDVTLAEVGRLRCEVRHGEDRKGKYRVLGALIYLRGQCPEAVLDMTVGGLGTRHAPLVWNVADDSATAALDALAAGQTTWGILFWVPLMQGAEDPATIARWQELAAAQPDARRRGDLKQIALVFAELAGRFLAWEKGLEDWKVTESQVVNRWIEKAETAAELRTARSILLDLLSRRFAGAVPTEIVDTVNQQPSLPLLKDWINSAATTGTVEEFLAVLRQ